MLTPKQVRDEISTLVDLRERQDLLARTSLDAPSTISRLKRSVRTAERKRVKKIEDIEESVLDARKQILKWWREGCQDKFFPRCTNTMCDSFNVGICFGVPVPIEALETANDVRRIFKWTRARGRTQSTQRIARPVLPWCDVGDVATLQNLKCAQHSALSLIIRWGLRTNPPSALLVQLMKEHEVSFAIGTVTHLLSTTQHPAKL